METLEKWAPPCQVTFKFPRAKENKTRSSAVIAEEISLKIRESELWQAVSGWKMYISTAESQIKQ